MEVTRVTVRIPAELKRQVDDYLKSVKAVDLKYSMNDCFLDGLRLVVRGGVVASVEREVENKVETLAKLVAKAGNQMPAGLSTSERLRWIREHEE